jgi:hypothetical protein
VAKNKVIEKKVEYDPSTKVLKEYVGTNTQAGGIKSQWWKEPKEDQFLHITAVTNGIIESQSYRQIQNLRYARLYANQEIMGFGVGLYDRANQTPVSNRISYNVVKSCVDTAASKIAKMRPRIISLTSGGSWSLQKRSEKLSKFIGGVFNEAHTYQEMSAAFLDACVFGTGCVKVYQDGEKIHTERVFINEMIIDDAEGVYGKPRQMHQVKYVSKDVLIDMFPEHAQHILNASSQMKADKAITNSFSADMAVVTESWHLRSGKNTKDGLHAITIENCTLLSEPYERDYFPFVFMRWTRKLLGFFGAGLGEELLGLQVEINKILRDIQSAQNLACVPRVLIESGSSVVEDHISNKIGSIIKYTGTRPEISTANAMPSELYNHLETLYNKAFQITGISQMSASSQKPAGLDSGVAIREFQDIETERFALVSQTYEDCFIEIGNQIIDLASELAEINPKMSLQVPGSQILEEIKWSDIKVAEDQFILQLYPASLLPTQPAGRLQKVQELLQSGMINQTTAKSLLNFPDIEDAMDMELAAWNDIHAVIEHMMETDEYSAPEPFQGPTLCMQIAQTYYLKAKTRQVEEQKLELLRRFIEDSAALLEASMPPAPEAAPAQQAVPEALPVSDLLPMG